MTEWYLVTADNHALRLTIPHENGRLLSMIEFSLNILGHQAYCPRETIAVTRLNRRIKVKRALLYQYVFLGVEPGACFYRIGQIKGIYQILEDAEGRRVQVRADQVERFRRNERYGVYDQTRRNRGSGLLEVGSKVRVLYGQFEGYTGIVRRSSGIENVRVFLANKFVVHLPIDSLINA